MHTPTRLGPPPHNPLPHTRSCYVATETSRQQALGMGLREEQLRLYGLPIRPSFSRRYPAKRRLRK